MLRVVLSIVSVGLIFLGLWMIASGFTQYGSASVAPQVVTAPRQSANPAVLGAALLAGGVVFFILILRRR